MNKSIVKPCSASKGLRFWCNFIPFEQRTSTGLQFYSASRFICVALFYSSHIESWVMSSICKWHMLEICLEVILTFLGLVKSPDLINDYHQNNFLEVFPWCLAPIHSHSCSRAHKAIFQQRSNLIQQYIYGQKFQKVENEENRFFAITSSKLVKNWFCNKHLVRYHIFHNYCFIYVL